MNVPQPNTKPIDPGVIPGRERSLLRDLVGGEAEIYWFAMTGTKVDVGSWFRKRRIAACVMPGELVLLAAGRRPFTARIPIADLRASGYNHVTGEFLPAPAAEAAPGGLKIEPREALTLMAHIQQENLPHARIDT